MRNFCALRRPSQRCATIHYKIERSHLVTVCTLLLLIVAASECRHGMSVPLLVEFIATITRAGLIAFLTCIVYVITLSAGTAALGFLLVLLFTRQTRACIASNHAGTWFLLALVCYVSFLGMRKLLQALQIARWRRGAMFGGLLLV